MSGAAWEFTQSHGTGDVLEQLQEAHVGRQDIAGIHYCNVQVFDTVSAACVLNYHHMVPFLSFLRLTSGPSGPNCVETLGMHYLQSVLVADRGFCGRCKPAATAEVHGAVLPLMSSLLLS